MDRSVIEFPTPPPANPPARRWMTVLAWVVIPIMIVALAYLMLYGLSALVFKHYAAGPGD